MAEGRWEALVARGAAREEEEERRGDERERENGERKAWEEGRSTRLRSRPPLASRRTGAAAAWERRGCVGGGFEGAGPARATSRARREGAAARLAAPRVPKLGTCSLEVIS